LAQLTDTGASPLEQARSGVILEQLRVTNIATRGIHRLMPRMWDEGVKLPTQSASGESKCFCGAAINLENTEQHVYKKQMDLK
jgi:hypothetical protein